MVYGSVLYLGEAQRPSAVWATDPVGKLDKLVGDMENRTRCTDSTQEKDELGERNAFKHNIFSVLSRIPSHKDAKLTQKTQRTQR